MNFCTCFLAVLITYLSNLVSDEIKISIPVEGFPEEIEWNKRDVGSVEYSFKVYVYGESSEYVISAEKYREADDGVTKGSLIVLLRDLKLFIAKKISENSYVYVEGLKFTIDLVEGHLVFMFEDKETIDVVFGGRSKVYEYFVYSPYVRVSGKGELAAR